MAIAKEIGGFTADELENRMSESEFMEWIEFFKLEKEEYERRQKKRGKGKSGMSL